MPHTVLPVVIIFKISLLEMNCNPALHTNNEPLKEVIPSLVEETLSQ